MLSEPGLLPWVNLMCARAKRVILGHAPPFGSLDAVNPSVFAGGNVC
jgi:hypothetical protein